MRAPLWRTKLRQYAESVVTMEFTWGFTDCASIVRGAVAVMTGVEDPWRWAVEPYTTEKGARRALKALGGWEGAMEAGGLQRVREGYTQDGDLVIEMDDEGERFPGVVVGGAVLSSDHEGGVYWRGKPQGPTFRLPGGSPTGVIDG